ncbi:MAG: class I SAM-dependent methyltransferase [Candidatus Hodarchaeales archaeon]|jgi:ubiquinone/menaquinone biosynthesis C-methylase UbiE
MRSSNAPIDNSSKKLGALFDLHHLEEKLMISPLKKLMLKYFELPIFIHLLRPLNTDLKEKRILEVGCGAGYGIEVINNHFQPKEYYAFDISKKMVQRSLSRAKNLKDSVKVFQGDITAIPLPSQKFDVVFIFTVLHHEVRWREALREVYRVLKPNGLLLVNEINNRSLNWFERYAKVYHPKAARFTWNIFRKELQKTGFSIRNEFLFLKDLGFFICRKQK